MLSTASDFLSIYFSILYTDEIMEGFIHNFRGVIGSAVAACDQTFKTVGSHVLCSHVLFILEFVDEQPTISGGL
jgi:hypothetical protein